MQISDVMHNNNNPHQTSSNKSVIKICVNLVMRNE